ncbi:ATP-dependent Clp protease proteolytic subunit [Actinomadura alba]|uniref:ATP-dependent Clp protease proteolytic subunit n=1 Tax=Actinomadura alba TaxID=406431 RepID=A0ABR7LVL5_9ACTN|nr:ATP-dependent Clp protease proteolytic subunit [Actinomadura alba]MBC6468892.1 ATP-dependent Clp protease proteolytic subunit [Actinomadura alba]
MKRLHPLTDPDPNVLSADPYASAIDPSIASQGEQVFQRLLRKRIIVLGQEVDDDIAARICGELLLLSAEDQKRDIHLYINSPGGSVTAGMAIYDIMQFVPNDVATLSMGFTASMGQFLLCAGAPGKRYALPHARILMHQPSGGIGGSASDIKIQAEQMLFTKHIMQERIAHHTGQPVERIEADSDRDRWYTAEEARDYGFIDHVVRTAAQVPAEAPSAATRTEGQ